MSELMPPMGMLEAGVHCFPVRVYYEDTDAGGIVYHATYLRFAERARSELLRVLGWPHDRIQREVGYVWIVKRVEVDYHQPARLDDALTIFTRLETLKGARMYALQTICRNDVELVRVRLQLVLVSPAGRPGRLPQVLKDALLPFLVVAESASES